MTDDEYFGNKAFCHAPWTSFYVWPNGKVENCCASTNQIGNLLNSTITEILSNKKQIEIKSNMLKGIRANGCDICYHNPATGPEHMFEYQKTQRYDLLDEHQQFDKTLYNDPTAFEYRYADLRFSNTCNYACVYCTPFLSSLWESELKFEKVNQLTDKNIKDLQDIFIKNAHTLKVVYLAGGEPLLIKESYPLIEHLYQVNPECKVKINTNLSIIKNNKMFDLLTQFPNCYWRVSVDDFGDRYNYIRYPGNWEIFWDNLQQLKSIVGLNKISFSVVYNALNAYTVYDLVDLLTEQGYPLDQIDIMMINHGQKPNQPFDPRSLPKSYIEKSLLRTKQYGQSKSARFNKNLRFVQKILETTVNTTSDLLTDLAILDQRRNLNSREVFPDIYNSF